MSDFAPDTQDVLYGLSASPSFAVDSLCYAAYQSGVRVSADGGVTWQSAFESLADLAHLPATAITVSRCFQDEHHVSVGVPGGILTSTDGGKHWDMSSLPTPAPFITALVMSPEYQEDGVFVTEDRGKRWAAWNFGLLDTNIFCLVMSPNFRTDRGVYAGTETGLYHSKNRGRSWRALPFPSGLCARDQSGVVASLRARWKAVGWYGSTWVVLFRGSRGVVGADGADRFGEHHPC